MERLRDWVMRSRLGLGVGMFLIGFLVSVGLAFAASSDSPPNGAQSALLVIIAGLFNLGGAWAVSRRPGDPNLTASRAAARHLAAIVRAVEGLKELAEEAFDRRPPGKSREDIGQLSWSLSDVEVRLEANLEDWTRAYPDLIERPPADAKGAEPEE